MRRKLALILSACLTAGALAGCGREMPAPAETASAATRATETVAMETTIPETTAAEAVAPETTADDYEIFDRLEETEAQAAQLLNRLMNDGNLTQADMNDLSHELYQVWDGLLNEIWGRLKETLPQEEMEQLTREERQWISLKEESIQQAAAAYGGGSLAGLAANQRGAELTRERVYVLAGLLAGQEISTPAEYNALYPSASLTALMQKLFLPLAEGRHVRDYDIFLRSAEEQGFTLREDEGIFYIDDPDASDSYLFGILAQEGDALLVSQLGYCRMTDSGERSVRVDFAEDTERYFISAVFWDDGTQVATLQEMMDYLNTIFY